MIISGKVFLELECSVHECGSLRELRDYEVSWQIGGFERSTRR